MTKRALPSAAASFLDVTGRTTDAIEAGYSFCGPAACSQCKKITWTGYDASAERLLASVSMERGAPADRLVTRSPFPREAVPAFGGPAGSHSAGLDFPVAALNLATRSAGIRPRSLTSMPWALAHSRTSVVPGRAAEALRAPPAELLVPSRARRPSPYYGDGQWPNPGISGCPSDLSV
jgi:hypothetical protein